jgi:DNA processing protein
MAGCGARCRRLLAGLPYQAEVLEVVQGTAPAAAATARRLATNEVPRALERAHEAGWQWVVPGDPSYPALLEHVSDPPLGLFVRGQPLTHRADLVVAVVGSRRATPYGRQVARLLGEELARAGVAVASGMARGVDGAAHQGALAAGGPTLAVWGTGPDRVYPPEHRQLAEAIAGSGALLTEYPPGTPPRRRHFPERNRILAGMARAVVVVEAAARSGALITARLALEEGREVLAVPGAIFSEMSSGPNSLLQAGAQPVLEAADVLRVLGEPAQPGGRRDRDAGRAERLLPRGRAATVDEMAQRSGLDVQEVLAELLQLELEGTVERSDDGRYSRR